MKTTETTDIKITTRARCWDRLGEFLFMIERKDGTVRVYDSIAGHYTLHHGMTKREESRVRNLAIKADDGE